MMNAISNVRRGAREFGGLARRVMPVALAAGAAIVLAGAPVQGAGAAESWRSPYAGDDTEGKHVLGYWTFDSPDSLEGESSHRHSFKLVGAVSRDEGRFGGCLESFPGWPVADDKHAAVVKHHPSLAPRGAFTIEMWIKPKADFNPESRAFLADKKYVANHGYQWMLSRADSGGLRRLEVNLGFGGDSASFTSQPAPFEAGQWSHVAFAYDGSGTVRFFRDGALIGEDYEAGRGAVAPGNYDLSIGDRRGSLYAGFPGFIDGVRICEGALEFRPLLLEPASLRTVFVRMEEGAVLAFEVRNLTAREVPGVNAVISLPGGKTKTVTLEPLPPNGGREISIPVSTALRPDTYEVVVGMTLPGEDGAAWEGEERFSYTVVARPLPHRMPVVMWGINGTEPVLRELPRLKEIGFTHCLGLRCDYGAIWKAGKPVPPAEPERVAGASRMLDTALANDLQIVSTLSPGRWARDLEDFQRVDRNGKPYDRNDVVALHPRIREFCRNVGLSMSQAYGGFPAYDAALIHTEVRGESQVSFTDLERDAFRTVAGLGIPDEVRIKNGVDYRKLKDFPENRVIADDDPILRYLRWFWKEGDGWNALHTAMHEGLKEHTKPDFWTFHDPAVRAPSLWGSGGGVDFLSQWTYTYPDPIRIGMATDELFAMAKGSPGQQVMKMTQIIWYRSQTAPAKDSVADASQSAWEDRDPDARYITIAPMHLREAFWTKLARPIKGIMYHGWQSLVPGEIPYAYRYTHPQTQHELARLIREVVQPLGPTLLQVPDRPAEVAFLESFTSQMFARRGTYGWNRGWAGDAYLMLHYAQLQPEIVYDETILRDGLEGFKVLVLTDCDVLTESLVQRIEAFQQRGGLVVADEFLCPAIKPDIPIRSFRRSQQADEDRKTLLAKAAKLRGLLEGRNAFPSHVRSDNPDIITRCRQFGSSDYVFVINDRREFGDYVGQHGLVMENGLPSKGSVHVRFPQGFVYDLLSAREIDGAGQETSMHWPVELGPAEGRVFLVTRKAIAAIEVDAPGHTTLGDAVDVNLQVVDAGGEAIDAVIPVEVAILDPSGREAEFSGYYGAAGGRIELALKLASNDRPGLWRIQARELASGLTTSAYVRVDEGRPAAE